MKFRTHFTLQKLVVKNNTDARLLSCEQYFSLVSRRQTRQEKPKQVSKFRV